MLRLMTPNVSENQSAPVCPNLDYNCGGNKGIVASLTNGLIQTTFPRESGAEGEEGAHRKNGGDGGGVD